MEGPEGNLGDVFEVDRVRQLVELMKEHDLSEIDLRQTHQRIRLRRGAEGPPTILTQAAAPVAAPIVSQELTRSPEPESKPVEDEKNIAYIKSPMVGTFYTKPSPNTPVYVNVGDHVGPETTVCIIEAMKVFNEIQAEISGTIIGVLVDNEEPVDYDKPLFKVDTSK